MSATEKHRDLSQLSALLAIKTATPAVKASAAAIKVNAPANDNKPAAEVLAWPALERLAHRGDYVRAYALRHWKAMCHPGTEIEVHEQENYDPEVTVEIRPSEGELLAAVGWEVVDRERWEFTGEMVNRYDPTPSHVEYRTNRNGDEEAQVGTLTFRKGGLIQWGTTKKGSALRPVERSRGIKGGASQSRSETAIWSYIKLDGAVSPLTAHPYAKPLSSEAAIGDCYDPLPKEAPTTKDKHGRYGVKEARQLLQYFGIDGSVAFEHLPCRATRCGDGLVTGDQWIGGVKKPKPLGEISAAAGKEPEFVRQVETLSYLDYLRRRLGKHAEVLDMAITNATAKEIGIAMGHAPTYSEKRGPALIDAAIDALIDIDETARAEIAATEEKMAA